MRSFIRFTKRTSDRALESEFRAAYQGAGVPYLFLAFVLSCLGFSAYYVLDMHAGAPVIGGVQTVRIFVASTFAGLALLLKLRPDVATPYYTLLANTTLLFGVLMADWVTARNHGHGPGTELLWNMNTTILATTLVVFGASRLTLLNTTAIAASGIVAGIVTLVALSAPLDGVARVTVNVLVIATTALTFRFRGENREWDLFVLAKENYNNSEGNKTKMRFLANMSHEVRTPLIGLIQIIDLVGASASAADRKLISKAKASGAALLNLLNGVLDYSALTTAGASRVVLAPTDLTAVCTTALSLHMAAISVKGLELRTRMDLGPTDVRVMTDGVLLFEIINNLMSNAIKFTDSGFLDLTVELRASPTSPSPLAMFTVEVVDTGIGISEENIQQIFAPFYQVDTSTSRKVGGTGLGLSIVKGLVDSLGGTITATSQVNVGTTMKVELPVEVVVQGTVNVLGGRRVWKNSIPSDPKTPDDPVQTSTFLDGRILLVEDNEINSHLYALYLSRLGFEVLTASHGAEAIEQFERESFDVVLMDCLMPVMDGFDATRRIRDFERIKKRVPTPIIAFTANNLAGDRERCLAAGMNDHFAKGLDNSELRALLTKWLPRDPHLNADV